MLGKKQSNILIIKTDGLASFVAAEPAFQAIREAHPDSKISLLTSPSLQRIARAAPHFDQVAGMPNFKIPDEKKAFVKQLKTQKFERVYDLAGDDDGKRLFSAMGPFRPKWHAVTPVKKKRGEGPAGPQLPAALLEGTGLAGPDRLPDFRWALDARKDSANMQPSWYGITTPFGLLLPSDDPARRWPAQGYAGMAATMAANGYMPVLAGHKQLHGFGDEIAHETPQLVDLTGKTDHLQLAALALEAAFFVSDGAEEMHLAMSVGCQGVLISDGKAPSGQLDDRHTVTLTANGTAKGDLSSISPDFVWRTLSNMGLVDGGADDRRTAAAR